MQARTTEAVLAALAGIGVAAAKVLCGAEVYARWDIEWVRALARDASGRPVKGTLFETGVRPASLDHPAGLLGADSRAILEQLAGIDARHMEALTSVFCGEEPS